MFLNFFMRDMNRIRNMTIYVIIIIAHINDIYSINFVRNYFI